MIYHKHAKAKLQKKVKCLAPKSMQLHYMLRTLDGCQFNLSYFITKLPTEQIKPCNLFFFGKKIKIPKNMLRIFLKKLFVSVENSATYFWSFKLKKKCLNFVS